MNESIKNRLVNLMVEKGGDGSPFLKQLVARNKQKDRTGTEPVKSFVSSLSSPNDKGGLNSFGARVSAAATRNPSAEIKSFEANKAQKAQKAQAESDRIAKDAEKSAADADAKKKSEEDKAAKKKEREDANNNMKAYNSTIRNPHRSGKKLGDKFGVDTNINAPKAQF